MGRHTQAACRLCRRAKKKLFLKGEKCYTPKCPVEKRPFAPGQHGKIQAKVSEYGIRLREKQQARQIYGLQETQFANVFDQATLEKGVTGEKLLELLERRLDNVVYRLGWSSSRPEGRQMVRHGHVRVNGRRVNIPSYRVKVGVTVTSMLTGKRSEELAEKLKDRIIPAWLELNGDAREGVIKGFPAKADVGAPVSEQLIVEYYSR